MERRGSDRIRRRIPCSFEYEGARREALVVDLSAGGVFLQSDLGIALGSELLLRLEDPACGTVELRGRVVRRRLTPAVIASWLKRGVGIQLLAAPETYAAVLRGEPAAEAAWEALADDAPPFAPPPAPEAGVLDIQVVAGEPEPELEIDTEALEESPHEALEEFPAEAPAAPVAEAPVARETDPPAAPLATWPAPPASPTAPAPCRADALLIHRGELADIAAVLEALGAETASRPGIEAGDLAGWERPPRLLVATGRQALRLSLGPNVEGQSIVAMAVVDSESQTLCAMLRRQGFRYVVRRPVHPEALRLLLGRALFRGRERRDAARVSLGCEVALRLGLWRKPATLLELSRTGCRLLLPEWVEPGTKLSLRIPPAVTGNRLLTLGGAVVRSERRRQPGEAPGVAVALRFERLDAATRTRLETLVAAHTLGPRPLERAGAVPRTAPAPAPEPAGERRSGRRVPYREELVALEPALERVRHTLIGIDLSPGGVRVEPHPELAVGDRVRLAIYDTASNGTLVVDAEAVRDQGVRGVLLRFRDLSEEARRQLEGIVEARPQIESAGTAPGEGVVVAEMLAQRPA